MNRSTPSTRPARAPWALAGALALALAAAGCGTTTTNPATGKTERTVMSEQDELQEGAKAHQEILKEYGMVQDQRLQAYVTGLGMRLARQSERPNLPWTFTVLDSPEVNAFALPGGYVYVTRGIMSYLDSEADLAGVIGHEIGHVTARHGAQRATRQQQAGLGALLGTVLGVVLESKGVAGAAQTMGQVSQAAAAGYIASYSRDQELQADQLGARYLVRNQLNPQNMVDVIGVLKNQERFAQAEAQAAGRPAPGGANWLSSHPSNDQRLAEIRAIAAKYKATGYADDGRARYQQAIEGLTFGDSREQGVVRGNHFYHEDLGIAISAPQGWKIQNSPEAILLVSPQGDAGVVVRAVPPKAGSTHEDIIRNVVKPVSGNTQRDTVNGLPITRFSGLTANAQGQQSQVNLSVITGPGNRNYLLQYAAKDANALQRAVPGFRTVGGSFRPLSDAERRVARPWTIRHVTLPPGGFEELARRSPLSVMPADQLRLLNNVYGTGRELRPGERVRIVE